jgi:hypothetical protein
VRRGGRFTTSDSRAEVERWFSAAGACRTTWALGLATVLGLTAACGGDAAVADGEAPWRTEADSTGDTIRVRITGAIPDRLVRTLVPEFEVGAQDASEGEQEEAVFGRISTVLGMPNGGLLVHDGQAEEVRLFGADGQFIRRVGGKGGGPGEFGHLNGITRLSNGDLIFWDANGNRLNRYRADGEFLGTWRMPFTGWFTQNALHSDMRDFVHAWALIERDSVSSGENNRFGFIRMDTSGAVLDTAPFPRWQASPSYLTAQSPDGRSMTRSSIPWTPGDYHRLARDGGLVSGAGNPYVIYVLPRVGKPTRIEREFTPIPVSSTEASERRAVIERMMKRLNPSWNWSGASIPASKPAYQNFDVGEDGRIWVRVYTAGEPIPEDELPPARPGPDGLVPPRVTTREPIVYDVFAPAGRLLGRVALPPGTRIYRTRGNQAWGVRQDEMDVEYAVRFRIEPALPR